MSASVLRLIVHPRVEYRYKVKESQLVASESGIEALLQIARENHFKGGVDRENGRVIPS